MVIGICTLELLLHGNQTLKGKRQILSSMKEKLKHRFNVSVAEVDHLEAWQRATLAVVMVSNDQGHVNAALDKVVDFIEESPFSGYLLDYQLEFI